MYFTIPDVRKERWENWYPVTFLTSILWIGVFSYLMVWWATVSGDVIGIPPPVSTLIACLMHSVENFEINFH